MSSALRPPTTPRLPEGRRIPASTTKSLLAYTASGCRNGGNRQRLVATAFCHDRRNGLVAWTIVAKKSFRGVHAAKSACDRRRGIHRLRRIAAPWGRRRGRG